MTASFEPCREADGGPLRVCHLGKYYPPALGGIETHVRTLAQAQAQQGLHVQVFCFNHQSGPTTVEQDGPVTVRRFGCVARLAKLDICPGLVRALADVQADVLHLHVPNPVMILALLLVGPRVPLVVTLHSDQVRQRFRSFLFRPVERWLYRRVRAILATSPPYASYSPLLRSYAIRVEVVPMGIDLRPYREPSAQHREQAAAIRQRYPAPIWLACGRLVYYKGLHNAVGALTQVTGTLLIVGDGPERQYLEAEARRQGVERRVHFLGNVASVVPYYHAADACWFPSNARSEAFGLVQVEAMASGCPVINTYIPGSGVPWVSRHEETGLTVPMDDPAAFAAAANRLLSEPGLRQRLANTARQRAEDEFDHRRMAERCLGVYRQVLGREAPQDTRAVHGNPTREAERA